MDNTNLIPTSLKVVAFLFFLGGIFALIEVVVSLAHGKLNLNFGLLGLFIGPGLLRFSRGWRTCALVLLWIAMIGIPIVAIFFMFASGPIDFKVFGQKVGHASKGLTTVFAAVMFVLEVWQYRVLTSQHVRRLFGVPEV
jgi:hypothetical protein